MGNTGMILFLVWSFIVGVVSGMIGLEPNNMEYWCFVIVANVIGLFVIERIRIDNE